MKKEIFFGIFFVLLFSIVSALVIAGPVDTTQSTFLIKPIKNFSINNTAYISLAVYSSNGPTPFTVNIHLSGGSTNLSDVYVSQITGNCNPDAVCYYKKLIGFKITGLGPITYTTNLTDNSTNTSTITIINGTAGVDDDGDGYYSIASGGDDCDDTRADVHPGAADNTNDGIDNDCDGSIDEDYVAPSPSPNNSGGGGGGGGGTGGAITAIAKSCLSGNVSIGKNDKIVIYSKSINYTFFVQDVLANTIQLKLYPIPSRDYAIDEGQSKEIDLDRNNRNDFLFQVKDVRGGKAIVACKKITEIGGIVEEEQEEEETTPVLQNVKEGILKIASEVVPKNKASPVVGSLIALAIVVAGLLIYYVTRKGDDFDDEF